MATVMLMHWPEVTKETYEQVRRDVKWETDVPEGAKYHVSWFDDGLHVLDIWESQAHFERFAQERLIPVTSKIVTSQPKVQFGETHRIFAPNP